MLESPRLLSVGPPHASCGAGPGQEEGDVLFSSDNAEHKCPQHRGCPRAGPVLSVPRRHPA